MSTDFVVATARPRAGKIQDTRWEQHRSEIERLYIVEKKTLGGDNGVISTMIRLHSFHARSVFEDSFCCIVRALTCVVNPSTKAASKNGNYGEI